MSTIRIHTSICDATPGLCAHDWQCQRTCPGKPARYSAQGKHADTLRQSIQAQHGLPTTLDDEARDRANAPAPTSEEAFAGLAAIVTAVLTIVAIGSALTALQSALAVIR